MNGAHWLVKRFNGAAWSMSSRSAVMGSNRSSTHVWIYRCR